MERKVDKGLLKTEKAYKRSKKLTTFLAAFFTLTILGGIIIGLYSSEKKKIDLENYKETDKFKIIYAQDIKELNKKYNNNELSRDEYDEKYGFISNLNKTYVEDNLLRSDSEIKEKIEKNDNLLVAGIGASVLGVLGVIGSGVIAAKKSEKFDKEND